MERVKTFLQLPMQALRLLVRLLKEKAVILFLRLRHHQLLKDLQEKDRLWQSFVVKPNDIWHKKREPGIAGFYRVHNEAELLEASVLSHLPYLDEIVIVYHDCTDATPAIAKKLSERFPEKVKVYHYAPTVQPAMSLAHAILPAQSPQSLVNYYNFALSKTTKAVAVKIDADHIAVSKKFARATEMIRTKGLTTLAYFFGVNVFQGENGELLVNKRNPFTAGYDCGFFPVVSGVHFVHRLRCESLRIPWRWYLSRFSLGVLFYHLKGVKKDKGLKPLSKDRFLAKEKQRIADVLENPELVPLEAVAKDLKMADVPTDISYNELVCGSQS